MNKITIDILRHGDVANGKRLRGKTDDPLSELGWQQMHAISENKTVPWQQIISSNLKRCQEFSTETAKKYSLPLSIEPHFQELDFGLWDGKLFSELYKGEQAKSLFQFMQSPSSITPPEGEAYQAFKTRVLTAWNDLLNSLSKDNIEHCLLVTHGGVIKVIISEVLGIPEQNLFRLDVPHACLSRITCFEDSPASLSFHNGHL